jgi:hypothetical protein
MLKTLALAGALALITTFSSVTDAQTSGGRHGAQPSSPSTADGATNPATLTPTLVGTWKSAADEMKLTSDFDKSVWGDNASAVRTLELTVRPSGEGTLRLTKKVVDGKGRVVPASTWIEEAQLQLGGASPGIASRIEHETTVVKGVRLFPDDPDYRWPLDGLRVKLVTFQDGDHNSIEVRYDTPEGTGSFWETLRRQGAAPRRKAQ